MGKTRYVVGAFLATALLVGGCSDSAETEKPTETAETQKLAGQRLADDNGVEYTLIDNGDGTETARYDDGRSVTFRRQEDGSLDYLYGAAGLIAGMAAGYYLFHGFSSPAGNWNAAQNRYTVSEPLQRRDDSTAGASTAARPSSNSTATQNPTTNSATTQNPTSNSNSKVNLSKDTAPKSGFGSAGARTSAAS